MVITHVQENYTTAQIEYLILRNPSLVIPLGFVPQLRANGTAVTAIISFRGNFELASRPVKIEFCPMYSDRDQSRYNPRYGAFVD